MTGFSQYSIKLYKIIIVKLPLKPIIKNQPRNTAQLKTHMKKHF